MKGCAPKKGGFMAKGAKKLGKGKAFGKGDQKGVAPKKSEEKDAYLS